MMRILVVDDDTVFREELSELLHDEGHEALTAPSVLKALEALGEQDFDLVFTDLKMPRQSGLDLLGEIRRRFPGLRVVMITGYATVSTAVEAMKLGAVDYVQKPFRADEIRKTLGQIASQIRFESHPSARSDPVSVAEAMARRDDGPVLLLTAAAPPRKLPASVEWRAFDGSDLTQARAELESFLAGKERGGLVIGNADRMLDHHRLNDIVTLVGNLAEMIRSKGSLALGMEATRISATQARALAATVAAGTVAATIEAVANPIRREVLRRLAGGPASFTELLRASELNDSPKLSFHLHRLVEEALIAHEGEEYEVTPKGKRAVGLLREMESVSSHVPSGNFLFELPSGASRRSAPK